MDLKLEVLSSCQIKKKTKSDKLRWIGTTKESLAIFDGKKSTALYLPSGKTARSKKKSLDSLPNILNESIFVESFCSGDIIGSIQRSGDIILYWRDTGANDKIPVIPEFAAAVNCSQHRPYLHVADRGDVLVLVFDLTEVFVWQRNAHDRSSGTWHKIPWPASQPEPSVEDNLETVVCASYYRHKFLGPCVLITVAFIAEDRICFPTAVVRWIRDPYGNSKLESTWCWSHFPYPVDSDTRLIQGALQAAYSPVYPFLAVAVNHLRPADICLLYVAPLASLVTARPMFGMGVNESGKTRSCHTWIVDIVWDNSGSYVIGATGLGLLMISPRLGSPCIIQSEGCCVDLGPALYLPVHPYHSTSAHTATGSIQLFTLAMHPRQPVFLFSDGFQITVFRLPGSLTLPTLLQKHIMAASQSLAELDPDIQLPVNEHHHQSELDDLSTDQMARVAQWTAALRMDSDSATLESRGPRRHASQDTLDTHGDEDEEDESDDNSAIVNDYMPAPLGRRRTSLSAALGGSAANLGSASQLNLVQPAEYSDSGLHSLFGDADSAETWVRRSRHHLVCGLSFLMSAREEDGGGSRAKSRLMKEELCNEMLEVWFQMAATLVATLSDVNSITGEEAMIYVFDELASQISEIFSLTVLDATDQSCKHALSRFLREIVRLLALNPALHSCLSPEHCLQFALSLCTAGQDCLSSVYSCSRIASAGVWWPAHLAHTIYPQLKNETKLESQHVVIEGMHPVWQMLDKLLSSLTERSDSTHQVCRPAMKARHKTLRRQLNRLMDTHSVTPSTPKTGPGNSPGGPDTHVSGVGGCVVFSKAEQLLLEGKDQDAIAEWQDTIQNMGYEDKSLCSKPLSRSLHSLFFLHVLRGDLQLAFNLVAMVTSMKDASGDETPTAEVAFLHPFLKQLNNKWQLFVCRRSPLVRTASRFMAAYFANLPIFIYPPHAPRAIPPVNCKTNQDGGRRIYIQASTVTNLIGQKGLADVFHIERCMEWLLLGGLLEESTWLADQLGDWRTATVLGWSARLAIQEEKMTGKRLQISANLDKALEPETILLNHAKSVADKIIADDKMDQCGEDICQGFRDILTAACMANLPLLESLLHYLIHERLQSILQNLSIFVQADVYLPAPPLFCPQPTPDKKVTKTLNNPSTSAKNSTNEVVLRRTISRIVDLINTILRAAFCALPCAGWYAQQLLEAEQLALQSHLRPPLHENRLSDNLFADYLPLGARLAEMDAVGSVRHLLLLYRNFSSIMWCLQARDKLSLLARQRAKQWSKTEEEWLTYCYECLEWCIYLLPFDHLFQKKEETNQQDNEFYQNNYGNLRVYFLSLLNEFEPEAEMAHLLVEWDFTESNTELSAVVQNKLRVLLKSWQNYMSDPSKTVFVKSKRRQFVGKCLKGESLSIYYQKALQQGKSEMMRRNETFGIVEQYPLDTVFNPTASLSATLLADSHEQQGRLTIGSRPFETEDAYFDFIDMFFSVCFSKALEQLDKSREQNDVPLILGFDDVIADREFTSMSHVAMSGSLNSPRSRPMPSPRSVYTNSSKGPESINESDSGCLPSPRPRSGSSANTNPFSRLPRQNSRTSTKSAHGCFNRSNSLERKAGSSNGSAGDNQRPISLKMFRSNSSNNIVSADDATSVSSGSVVPMLNFAGLNSNTVKVRRASLSDYRDKNQVNQDQVLFTPRSESVGYKTAPYITDVNIDADKQSLYDRMNWLVRWTYRNQGVTFATSTIKSAANGDRPSMRIRLNTNLLVYTIFGVDKPKRSRTKEPSVESSRTTRDQRAQRIADNVRSSQFSSHPSTPSGILSPQEAIDEEIETPRGLHLELARLTNMVQNRRRTVFSTDTPASQPPTPSTTNRRDDSRPTDRSPASSDYLNSTIRRPDDVQALASPNSMIPSGSKRHLSAAASTRSGNGSGVPEDDPSQMSVLSDQSNMSLLSHSDRVRNIARIKLAGFMEEAKNGQGPLEENVGNNAKENKQQRLNSSDAMFTNDIATKQFNNNALLPESGTSGRSEESTTLDISSLTGNGNGGSRLGVHFRRTPASSPSGVPVPQQSAYLDSNNPPARQHFSSEGPSAPYPRPSATTPDNFRGNSNKTRPKEQHNGDTDRTKMAAVASPMVQVDPNQLTKQMEKMMRTQIKQIFQLQQANLMTMLGAVDESGDPRSSNSLHLPIKDDDSFNQPRYSERQNSRKNQHRTRPANQDSARYKPGRSTNRSDDLTDITVTDFATERTTARSSARRKKKQEIRRVVSARTANGYQPGLESSITGGHGAGAELMALISDSIGEDRPLPNCDDCVSPIRQRRSQSPRKTGTVPGTLDNMFLLNPSNHSSRGHYQENKENLLKHAPPLIFDNRSRMQGFYTARSQLSGVPQSVPFPLLKLPQDFDPEFGFKSPAGPSITSYLQHMPLLNLHGVSRAGDSDHIRLGSHMPRNPIPRLLPPQLLFEQMRQEPSRVQSHRQNYSSSPRKPSHYHGNTAWTDMSINPLIRFSKQVEAERAERFGQHLLHVDFGGLIDRHDSEPDLSHSLHCSHRGDSPSRREEEVRRSSSLPPGSPRKSWDSGEGRGTPDRGHRRSRGTTDCVDIGVQHDEINLEDNDFYVHHGFAFMPGFIQEKGKQNRYSPRYTQDANINTSPRKGEAVGVRLGRAPVLPPDLVGNLCYGDNAQQATGRRFLSVVSVDEGVWDDLAVGRGLPATLPDPAERSTRDSAPSTPRNRVTVPVSPRGGDAVTRELLEGRQENLVMREMNGASSASAKSKLEVLKALDEMNLRLRAIDDMSGKLEKGYHQTRKLTTTYDLREAQSKPKSDRSVTDREAFSKNDLIPRTPTSTPPPVSIGQPMSRDKHASANEDGPTQDGLYSLVTEDEISMDQYNLSGSPRRRPPLPKQTSIDGEHHGPVEKLDLREITQQSEGFDEVGSARVRRSPSSNRAKTAASSQRGSVRRSVSPHYPTPRDLTPPPGVGATCFERSVNQGHHGGKRTQAERDELKAWIAHKRSQRMAAFKKDLAMKVSEEAKPFRPSLKGMGGSAPTSLREGDLSPEKRERERRERERQLAEQRQIQVRRMIGQVMAECGIPEQKHENIPVHMDVPPSALEIMEARVKTEEVQNRRKVSPKRGYSAPRKDTADYEFENYEDYDAYIDRMTELSSVITTDVASSARGENARQQMKQRGGAARPFTKMVKVRRPEITRKGVPHKPMTYAQQLQSIQRGDGGTNLRNGRGGISKQTGVRNIRSAGATRNAKGPQTRPVLRTRTYNVQPSGREGAHRSPDDRSLISDWSVGSNVKRILYGAESERSATVQSMEDLSYISRGTELYEAGSVQSDSCIDWDQVDQMINSPT